MKQYAFITISLLPLGLFVLQTNGNDALLDPLIATKKTDSKRPNFTDLCKEFEQPCAEYDVITKDGYILKLHRIKGIKAKPLLLWHGILDSSDTFILRGKNSTGISLAEDGYDVWLGNSRGNKYCLRHTTLDPEKDKIKFWDFSFHEMALYDMSAVIDFILEETGQEKLAAIGHSQGTTIFYTLASLKPMYNQKVQPFISLAPIAFLTNLKPLLKVLIPLWPALNTALSLTGTFRVLQDQSAATALIELLCSNEGGNEFCEQGVVMPIAGDDTEELHEFMDVIFRHYPSGTSTKALSHFAQVHTRKRFSYFDYGAVRNLVKYDSIIPPDYELKNVTAPVVLLCGANDRISTLEDVELLRSQLPNVVKYKVMDREKFNHIDFVWGKNINVYLNPLLRELLNEFA